MTRTTRSGWLCLLIGLVASTASCTAEQKVRCGAGTELVAGKCEPMALDGAAPDGDSGAPESDAGPARECGEGTFSVDGSCLGKRPIGAPCDDGLQCSSGTCLGEDRGASNGYCTITACSENRPCPAGSRCYFSSTEEAFLCLTYCDDDEDCRDDYACQPLYTSDAQVCAPSCANTGACPSGTLCDENSGKCLLHQCVLGAADACGSGSSEDDAGVSVDAGAAEGELVCYADRLGLSVTGAVCLPACDPLSPEEVCASNEVCQPLPEDPMHSGLCVPPLCASTEDCSAGAVCMEGVCQPPARCDGEGQCDDEDTVCVGGAGGQCMAKCPEDDGQCSDLHAGLSCEPTLGACLPTGAFPGSACRPDLRSPCSALSVRDDDGNVTVTPMTCEDNVCLASCAAGGNALCQDISPTLSCAEGVFDAPTCLPGGSFPGGPCDDDDACAPLAIGSLSVPMICARDKCLITCDDAAGGDLLCDAIDASLLCTADAFGGTTDVCLPRGAYPGGPCAAGDLCDAGMACKDDKCLYQCSAGGETLCNAVSDTLSCASGIFDEPVCLPRGTYPGSPCRGSVGDECDENLSGLPDADMFCTNNVCAVQCEALTIFASGDAVCGTVSPTLTCVASPTSIDFCTTACVGDGNLCPTGYSCLMSQDACLPTGSFLGSPCAGGVGGACAGSPMLRCAPNGVCGAGCEGAQGPSGYCQGVAAAVGTTYDTCFDVHPAPEVEVLLCIDGTP